MNPGDYSGGLFSFPINLLKKLYKTVIKKQTNKQKKQAKQTHKKPQPIIPKETKKAPQKTHPKLKKKPQTQHKKSG